jgi:murein DD-endopeptidase MepM/ murein hydrolase activator NlpD
MEKINEARRWLTHRVAQGFSIAKKNKGKTTAILLLFSMFITGSALANHYYNSNDNGLYEVDVDGKSIGYVNNPQVIQDEMKQQLEKARSNGVQAAIANEIEWKREIALSAKPNNEQTLQQLEDLIRFKAVELSVNNQAIGDVSDEGTLQSVLQEIKSNYTGKAAAEDTEVKFKEPVTWKVTSVTSDRLLTQDQLKTLITQGTLQKEVHTIVQGDTVESIAKKYGIKRKDVFANNSGITEDTLLKIGQQLIVTARKPLLTVQVITKQSVVEKIPYAIQMVPTDSLYRGDSKVLQEGIDGEKNVIYETTMENNVQTDKKAIQEQIIKQPVDKKVLKGTKVKPSRGDGHFSWPADGGVITSGYGMRWGKMHLGLDIAGTDDLDIKAADNGVVEMAGSDGTYGNCVIIDHGNGYQTRYAHLSSIKVSPGQVVEKGDALGIMGETGDATGVHLHFEIIKDGSTVNPLPFFRG